MSRIGKQPVSIPADVTVDIDSNTGIITFTKAKNKLTVDTKNLVNVKLEDKELVFTPKTEDRKSKAFWGTFRALSVNAVKGLVEGFEKKLEINGVGYKVALKGKTLELQLGYSHPINYELPEGIEAKIEKNVVSISGINNQVVGQVAAEIRQFRKPEPYKGKGVKYLDEVIVRKAGKTGSK
ncbi:MAG: LSU ribosomal protein L6p (L9e) [uncultured Campylobacterales bacterium]|uniref:Large ribosomal subunit protein uL6 n=1 Tax=uncultured Campylobacterales bacterium TaxID=352960 RepID=A0A6S6SIE6_9BACT|nr:MAG: LSU ribosomal protein L6p (L9e) [uncultured Campylobacterales bacterium]